MSVLFQLPDDVVAKGYREVRPFHHEQLFHSPSADFTGTESEFVKAGLGYSYVQIDKSTRRVVEDYREAQKTAGQVAYEADVAARPTYDGGAVRKTWSQLGDVEKLSWERNPTPRWARTNALDRLEALNVEICGLAGAGHPDATPEQIATYDRIMAERADEIRAAIAEARNVTGLRPVTHNF